MASPCKFVASDQPRILPGRHNDPCTCDGSRGCQPCPEMHCVICGREHAYATCTTCLEAARSDLQEIATLCASLPAEAVEKGVESEAMVLLGPASDPHEWRTRATAALFGRFDDSYLNDCRDELHPLWVLGTWEQMWRDFLDHQSDAPIDLYAAVSYLDLQMTYMSDHNEPPFEEFARDLRACRAHLEAVLHDGAQVDRGGPCVRCETPMTRVGDDGWRCGSCRLTVTEEQYRWAIGAMYHAYSDRMTAAQLSLRIGVSAGVIRVWGSRGKIRRHGRNTDGLMLYDVADAIAKRDEANMGQTG